MKRAFVPIVLSLLLCAAATPAEAAKTTVFRSNDLELRARLAPRHLYLTVTSRSHYPMALRCTLIGRERYRLRVWDDANPHEVSTLRTRWRPTTLRDLSAECHVRVDDDLTLLWRGASIEALASRVRNPSGQPGTLGTLIRFYNITPRTVTFTCSWDWGRPPVHERWRQTLDPYASGGGIQRAGVSLRSVRNFTCSR